MLGSPLGDMVVRIVGDNAVFDKTIDTSHRKFATMTASIAASSANIQKSFKQIEGEAAVWGNSVELIRAKQDVLKTEISSLIAAGIDPLDDRIEKLQKEYYKLGAEADALAKKQKTFTEKLTESQRATEKAGRTLTMGLTLPIVGAGVVITKLAGSFEKAMNKVRALTGATGDEFKKLEDQARMLGATTQFTANQAADAMGFMAMAGFNSAKIYSALPSVLSLAASAQIDLGTSADIVTNIMAGFNLTSEELAGTVDILTKQFISSNTDLSQLGQAFKYAGPIAKSFGVSIEEVSAAIGFMSNAGIQGTMAGTSLRGILGKLATESKKLGITTLDASGNMRPLGDIINDLNAAGLSASDSLEIFGDRAGPAMAVLLAAGGDALNAMIAKLQNVDGLAKKIASTQMEGFNGQLLKMSSAAQETGIAFGDILLPHLTALALKYTETFSKLTSLNTNTKETILIIAGFTAVLGPALLAVSLVQKAILLLNAGMLANPAALVTAAVVALAAGIAVFTNNIKNAQKEQDKLNKILGGGTTGSYTDDLKTINDRMIAINAEIGASEGLILSENAALETEKLKLESIADSLTDNMIKTEQRKRVQEKINLLLEVDKKTEEDITAEKAKQAAIDNKYLGTRGNVLSILEDEKSEYQKIQDQIDELEKTPWASGKLENDRLRAIEILHKKQADVLKEQSDKEAAVLKDKEDSEAAYFKKYFEKLDEKEKKELQKEKEILDKKKQMQQDYLNAVYDGTFKLVTAVQGFMQADTDFKIRELEKQYEAELRLLGLADQTIMESLEERLADAKTAGDTELQLEIEKEIEREKIKEKYAALEAKINYENALAQWKINLAMTAVAGARSVVETFKNTGGWPWGIIPAGIMAGIAAAQLLILKKNKPQMAAGGIVMPSTGGTDITVAEKRKPEVIFPLDRLQEFIAERPGSAVASEGMIDLTVQLDTDPIFRKVFPATRNRKILIHQGAIVK